MKWTNLYKNQYDAFNAIVSNDKLVNVCSNNQIISEISGDNLTITRILDIIDAYNYFVFKPLKNMNELVELSKHAGDKFEFSLEYLIKPESWQGPLDMQCVISLNDAKSVEASFYNKNKNIWLPQNDLEIALKKIGLICNKEGLLIVTKGSGDQIIKYDTRFNSEIPYFSLHYHPINDPFPSDVDVKLSSEINCYKPTVKIPVNELFTLKNKKEKDDLTIIKPFNFEDFKNNIKAHHVDYISRLEANKMLEIGFAKKFKNEEGLEVLIPKNIKTIALDNTQTRPKYAFLTPNIVMDNKRGFGINFNSKVINDQELIIFYTYNSH